MVAMNLAALLMMKAGEIIANYFREKGAISPDKAIVPDMQMLIERSGLSKDYVNFASFPYIVEVGGGKYYLDEEKVKRQKQIAIYILLVFALCVLVILGIIIVFVAPLL